MSVPARLAAAACLALAALGTSVTAAGDDWPWPTDNGFPLPRIPADNPMSEARFQLGRHLFYDRRLSGNATLACADCHR